MKTSVHSATAKQLGYVLQVTCVMIFTVCEIITSLIFSYGRVPSKATFERKCKVRKKLFYFLMHYKTVKNVVIYVASLRTMM